MARLARGKASRTARATAAMRARHAAGGAKPLVFEDRFAHLFLDLPSAALAVPMPFSDIAIGRIFGPVRGLEGEVLARSRYVEEALTPRLAAGLDQVVILGAGFDTTALAHKESGATFFEVDHPATQADKRAILARHEGLGSHIVFVAVDFAKDDLVEKLLAAGLDPQRPSLTSWLGVVMYLEQSVTLATLAKFREVAPSGSLVIFDAYPRDTEIVEEEKPMFAAARAATGLIGEPMIGAFDSPAFAKALPDTRWRIADRIDGDVMRERWFAKQPHVIWPPRSALFYTLEAV
jgi:methyltransferase (TIGR00027 family)